MITKGKNQFESYRKVMFRDYDCIRYSKKLPE